MGSNGLDGLIAQAVFFSKDQKQSRLFQSRTEFSRFDHRVFPKTCPKARDVPTAAEWLLCSRPVAEE